MVKKPEAEPFWTVERAQDCKDDFLVISTDSRQPVVRIEPYNPHHPVESATRGYAEVICNLLNKSAKWQAKIMKAQDKLRKEAKKNASD